jgi:outer membrane protein assembly factor BamB
VGRPVIALGVLVLIMAAGATAYVLGIGPLAPPAAARSVVFVAISRSSDEADAREIEAIDLDAGTRALFDAGGRITALAVSPDRRSLYVGLDGGKVVMLDATTGTRFAEVDVGGSNFSSLVATADGRTLFALATRNGSSTLVPIDLGSRKAGDPIAFTMTAGAAVLRDDTVVIPLGDGQRLQVAFVDVGTRAERSRLTLPLRGSLVPPAAFRSGVGRTGILAYDGGLGGGALVRVYLLAADPLHSSEVALEAANPSLQVFNRPVGIGLQAAVASDGTIHACNTVAAASRRYVVGTDLKSASAGTDCGPLAGGDQVLMAKRDPAQLAVLDARSGRTIRTLPLAGVPARLAR